MGLSCDNCGAPLKPDSSKETIHCAYCGAGHTNAHYRPRTRTPVPPPAPTAALPAPRQGGILPRLAAVLGMVVGLPIMALAMYGQPHIRDLVNERLVALGIDPYRPAAIGRQRPRPSSDGVEALLPSGPPAAPPLPSASETPGPAPQTPPEPTVSPAVSGQGAKSRRRRQGADDAVGGSAPNTPVLSKAAAKQALEPEILGCMRAHNVHYLITRIGQGHGRHESGNLPPMKVVERSIVDYVPSAGFERSPLGRCVNAAAKKVRASAFKGNYIYFNLRNAAAPDPLSGQPMSMDRKRALAALAALDAAARQCATTHPKGSKPGESVQMNVTFRGIDGTVTKVEPFYVDRKSPYYACLRKVFGRAVVPKFRDLDAQVNHVLQW